MPQSPELFYPVCTLEGVRSKNYPLAFCPGPTHTSTPASPVTGPQTHCLCRFLFLYAILCPQIIFLFIQTDLVQGHFHSIASPGLPREAPLPIFLSYIFFLSNFNVLYCTCVIVFYLIFKTSVSSVVYILFEGQDHVKLIPVSKALIIAPQVAQ